MKIEINNNFFKRTLPFICMALMLLVSVESKAQLSYNIGTGLDGPFNATVNTTLPGGVYNFTTFNIDPGVTVMATGAAPLIIRCTGNVTINGGLGANGGNGSNGVTYSNGGAGGIGVAGGGNGGNGSFAVLTGPNNGTDGIGDGGVNNHGSGWSGGGGGGYATIGGLANGTVSNGGPMYGDIMVSTLPSGSGGGGGSGGYDCGAGGGGAGGGLIVINSGGSISIGLTGSIIVNGGNGGSDGAGNCGGGAGGSGGTIWLAAPNVNHTGVLQALGGLGGASQIAGSPYYGIGGNGANGRIRVDYNTGSTTGSDSPTIGYHTTISSIPLPVNIISFEGTQEGDIDKIQWSSNAELNNDEYILLHSTDSKKFSPLAHVKSQSSNSAELLMYAASNQRPQIGHNYYRLQQKDIDGKVQTVSETIDLYRDLHGNILSLSPNPSNGLVYFQAHFEVSVKLKLQVIDMQGKVVQEKSIHAESGNYQCPIDLQSLPNGLYNVTIRNEFIQWSQTVTKQ